MLHTILIVLGLVCFVLAGFNVNPPKINIGWIGAAFIGAALLL